MSDNKDKRLHFAKKWLEATDETTKSMVELLMDDQYIQAFKDVNDYLLKKRKLSLNEINKMFESLQR